MRPRKEIETNGKNRDALILEVLLDIRDLLARTKRQSAVLSDA